MKIVFTLVFILFLGLIAGAQTQPVAPASTRIASDEAMLMKVVEAKKLYDLCFVDFGNRQCEGRKPDREMTAAVVSCINDKKCAPLLISNTIAGYAIMTKSPSISPALVSEGVRDSNMEMQMILIAQNQRIIELLEEIAKKKQ